MLLVDILLVSTLLIGLSGARTEATLVFWAPYYKLFALGIYAKSLSQNWLSKTRARAIAMIRVVLAVVAIACTQSDLKSTITAIVVFTVLSIEQNTKARVSSSALTSIAVFLGSISYSIYLLHVPIGCWVLARLRPEAVLDSEALHLLADTTIASLIICFSAFFYKRVELVFHKLARKIGSV